MAESPDPLMTIKEVAEDLNISERSVRRLVLKDLASILLGPRLRRVKRSVLDAWKKKHSWEPSAD